MPRLILFLALAMTLAGCSVDSQNSDKQKDLTSGSTPPNGMTATEQQNYGAGNGPQNTPSEGTPANGNTQGQSPNHTNNLTNPSPTTPKPQASGQNASQNPQKK